VRRPVGRRHAEKAAGRCQRQVRPAEKAGIVALRETGDVAVQIEVAKRLAKRVLVLLLSLLKLLVS